MAVYFVENLATECRVDFNALFKRVLYLIVS